MFVTFLLRLGHSSLIFYGMIIAFGPYASEERVTKVIHCGMETTFYNFSLLLNSTNLGLTAYSRAIFRRDAAFRN